MEKTRAARPQEKQEGGTPNSKVNLGNITRKKQDVSLNWKIFKSTMAQEKNCPTPVSLRRKQPPKSTNIPPKFGSEKFDYRDKLTSSERHVEDKSVIKTNPSKPKITRHIAMDCEMVGVDDNGKESILARVSLVNKFGDCIYDKFVKPRETVTDYRTRYSGVREKDLKDAEDFEVVQKDVAEILKGRVLVGHALSNDLKVLFLGHPRKRTRDTSKYRAFRKLNNNRTPSLRQLAKTVLGVTIQQGEHDSIIDANTAMQLYLLYRKEWEKELHLKKMKRSQQ